MSFIPFHMSNVQTAFLFVDKIGLMRLGGRVNGGVGSVEKEG